MQETIEERNKQTALTALESFNKRNIDSVLVKADKEMVEYGDGSFQPVKGADSITKEWKAWMNALPDYKGSNFTAVADGNTVMIYGEWSGTWTADFMGMKATGKPLKIFDVDIFKFNDEGKIIEHRSVQSVHEVARQIGMTIPQNNDKQ